MEQKIRARLILVFWPKKKPPTANFSATYLCTVIEIATQNLAWTIFRPEIAMKEYGADILGKYILAENNNSNSNNFCYTYVHCTGINIVTKNSTRKIFRLKNSHEYEYENSVKKYFGRK